MLTIGDVFSNANCGDHPLGIEWEVLDGAETILALGSCDCYPADENYKTCGSWCGSGSFALGKLKDGRYMVVRESSDSTGHGCQCSGSASFHDTLEDAVRLGLGSGEREAWNSRR